MHALSSDRAEAKMHTGEKTFGPMHTGESGQKEEEEQDLKSELSHLHWASTICLVIEWLKEESLTFSLTSTTC